MTYLNAIVHSHRKSEKVFFLTTRDFRCVHHGWHGTHRYDIQILATHASTFWGVCGNNLNIVLKCAVSPVVHTSNIPSCQKKTFSVFLWLMFLITKNITKRPVFFCEKTITQIGWIG